LLVNKTKLENNFTINNLCPNSEKDSNYSNNNEIFYPVHLDAQPHEGDEGE
jgi:hypothetical protein